MRRFVKDTVILRKSFQKLCLNKTKMVFKEIIKIRGKKENLLYSIMNFYKLLMIFKIIFKPHIKLNFI